MENGFVLTDEILKTLKCSLCGCYLSVSPISIISEDGTKYKCGRCHSIKTHIETKVIMYENLAKFMVFPCIYKNCTEKLKWSNVKDHEKKCPHRTIVCPKAGCDEELGINDVASHFKEKHPEVFHTDKFILRNIHNYYSLDVMVKDDKTYIIIFDYDDSRYGISVCAMESDSRQYEVIINSDNSKYSILCTEQSIIPFDKRVHCFKCVTGVCKNEAHIYRYYRKGILKRMTTKIERDAIKRTFLGSSMNYTVNIVDVKPEVDEDLDDLIVKDMIIDEVNDEEEDVEMSKEEEMIRRMLECPNCFEYMQPPIFQCATGHTTCKKCKETLTKCPTCQAEISTTKNLALEEAANSLKMSSLVAEKTSQADNDKTSANEITCPRVNCHDTYDLKTIAAHFKEKHADSFHWNIINIKNIYAYFNIDVVVRYGKTYLALFDYNDMNFGVSLLSIYERDEDMYEVKLTSENGKISIIATEQKIIPFDELEHCFKCLSGTCQNSRHKYRFKRKTIFRRMPTKFNRDCINRTFNYSVLNYVISLIDSKKFFTKDFQQKKDKIFRKMYECPVCKNYMSPPIQQCLAGHSFCKPCVVDAEKCPQCEAKVEGTRNYILEEMAESVELPCQPDAEACQFRANIKRIASHKDECPVSRKKARLEAEKEHKVESNSKAELKTKEEPGSELEIESKAEPKPKSESKVELETKPESKLEPESKAEPESKPESKAEPGSEAEPEPKANPESKAKPESAPELAEKPESEQQVV